MTKSKAAWDFPRNNGGVSYGLTDAARTYFQADRLRHVIREVIQNSLDSHDSGLPDVKVEMFDCKIPKTAFGGKQLASHFSACIEEVQRTNSTNSQRDIEALQKGLNTLEHSNIRCLRIVDSGTKGLRPENWHALVEAEGIVQKEGTIAGGSFGIGKNAVFTISDIFTVVYSTRYLDGRRGRMEKCQGKARLMTHPMPQLNGSKAIPSPKDFLQHTGFYRSKSMMPLVGKQEIPDEFRLNTGDGTGIFILGFNPHSEDWATDVQGAVCENFFTAIHNRWLTVTVRPASGRPIIINHESISEILSNSLSSQSYYHFYKAIASGQAKHATQDLPSLGKLDVFLDSRNGPSRTAYINRKGMLITESSDQKINPVIPRRRFTWTDYTAVVIPQTDLGDLWVRTMESPAHDAIQPEQLPEPEEQQQAKAVFKDLRAQLRKIIDSEMETHEIGPSENVTELAPYLPEAENRENEELSAHHFTVTKVPTRPPDIPIPGQDYDYESIGQEYDDQAPDEQSFNHTSSKDLSDNNKIEGLPGEISGIRHKPSPQIPIQDPRAILVNSNQIRISFTPDLDTAGAVEVAIHPRGYEPTIEEPISIKEATCLSHPAAVRTQPGTGRVELAAEPGARISILVTTDQPIGQMSAFNLFVYEVL